MHGSRATTPRAPTSRSRWESVTDRWARTPGYLKWLSGLVAGAVARLLYARLFPERWESFSHRFLDPTMPIWLAIVVLVLVLVVEHLAQRVYHWARAARAEGPRLRPLFGVRWATPPDVDHIQGPYCASCPTRLRGTLWSGEASPTLWICPACGREHSTPEFPDIAREASRQLGFTAQSAHQP